MTKITLSYKFMEVGLLLGFSLQAHGGWVEGEGVFGEVHSLSLQATRLSNLPLDKQLKLVP